MHGRLLIVDSIATNRIILKVRLQSALYDVQGSASLDDALPLVSSQMPDAILVNDHFAAQDRAAFMKTVRGTGKTAHIPIVVLQAEPNRADRLTALKTGANEVFALPLSDTALVARLRSLLRPADDQAEAVSSVGFCESTTAFQGRPKVVVAAEDEVLRRNWRNALRALTPYDLREAPLHELKHALCQMVPDIALLPVDPKAPDVALRQIADVQTNMKARRTALIAVSSTRDPGLLVDLLDLGAQDVVTEGFDPEEIALRMSTVLQQKRARLNHHLNAQARARMTDVLTGLFTKAYGMTQLANILESGGTDASVAVMIADVDDFKAINQTYGLMIGDTLLRNIAVTLRSELPAKALLSRLEGDAFLIVLPNTTPSEATTLASQLCKSFRATPTHIQSSNLHLSISVSLGVAIHAAEASTAADLLTQAQQALSEAKYVGGDQVAVNDT